MTTIEVARTRKMLSGAGHALAVASVAVGLVRYFLPGLEDLGAIFHCVLASAPLPVAWWIGRRVARTTVALRVLVAGMALAQAFQVDMVYGDVVGPRPGLLLLGIPVFQLPFLAVIVLIVWLVARRTA